MTELDVARTPLDTTAQASLTHRDRKRRTTRRVLALLVLMTTLVVEIALIAPYVGRVTTALGSPDVRWLLVAVTAELVSMGAFARVQRRMLRAGGARVAMRRMVAVTYAANAVSVTLPAGTALAAGYVFKRLRSWGATVPAATFTLLASGVLSTLSFALLTVVCALLAGGGALTSLLAGAGVAVVACAALLSRRRDPDLAGRIVISTLQRANRILRRAPDAGVAGLRRIVAEISAIKPRPRDWLAGFGLAELNWLADLACLVGCCDAVGTQGPSLRVVTLAYVAGTTATSLTFLPGGLGVTDAAMIFTLTQGGVSTGSAAAAVLLYRLISFALVVALGWLIWAIAWIADQHRDRLHHLRWTAGASPDTSPASAPAPPAERTPTVRSRTWPGPNAHSLRNSSAPNGSTRVPAALLRGVVDARSVDGVRDAVATTAPGAASPAGVGTQDRCRRQVSISASVDVAARGRPAPLAPI